MFHVTGFIAIGCHGFKSCLSAAPPRLGAGRGRTSVVSFLDLWTRLVPNEWHEPRTKVRYHLGRPQSHRLGRPLALQVF